MGMTLLNDKNNHLKNVNNLLQIIILDHLYFMEDQVCSHVNVYGVALSKV